ncbi:hypothetical protein [Streptomyces pseudovenezuelae]|uniref:hypothetical protein n=1 Tax=Streptomyces pseudovenezuelae TaxID=67350 RepID=UPI0036E73CBF
MVQLRVMTDDHGEGEEVLALLEPLLQACTALVVSEPTELHHRGGGLRVVYTVLPAPNATTVRVQVERDDPPAGPARGAGRRTPVRAPRRQALPPGS